MTTSILPLVLGQAVLGRAVEPDGPAPQWLRINGECWKLVTDPAAIQAAKDALEARERADDAFAMAQFAPRIANRPPTPADAEGKGPGAGWLEYDPATQLLKQMWRWDGAEWLALPMDPVMIPVIQIGTGTAGDLTADRLIVTSDFVARVAQILELSVENLVVTEGATINELVAIAIAGATAEFQQAYIQNLRSNGAEIDEAVIGVLASNIITSGLFRTAEAGQRLEIDSNGLVMWGVDPDGAEYEMVRLGPSGENLLTIGDSTISTEGVRAPSGSFDDLTIGGDTLDDLLWPMPRGVVGFAYEGSDSAWDGTGDEIVRLQAEAELMPNRRYSVTVDQHYVATRAATASSYVEQIRWSITGDPVTPSSSVLASARHFLAASTSPEGIPGMTGWIDTHEDNNGFGTSPRMCTFAMTMRSAGGTDTRLIATSNYPLRISIRDEGPTLEATGRSWFHVGTPSGGGSDAPAPKPEVKRYTRTWNQGGYGGDVSSGDIVQGYYSGVGMRSGSWRFPAALKTALAGATIERFEVYLYANHWWYGAGGTANIRATDGNWKGFWGSQVASSGWPRNAGRWVTVPSDWLPNIANGRVGGIGVSTASTSSTYYGRFTGSATRFRATWRK